MGAAIADQLAETAVRLCAMGGTTVLAETERQHRRFHIFGHLISIDPEKLRTPGAAGFANSRVIRRSNCRTKGPPYWRIYAEGVAQMF